MRKLVVITAILLLLILSGCSSPAGNNNQVNNVVPDTPSPSVFDTLPDIPVHLEKGTGILRFMNL